MTILSSEWVRAEKIQWREHTRLWIGTKSRTIALLSKFLNLGSANYNPNLAHAYFCKERFPGAQPGSSLYLWSYCCIPSIRAELRSSDRHGMVCKVCNVSHPILHRKFANPDLNHVSTQPLHKYLKSAQPNIVPRHHVTSVKFSNFKFLTDIFLLRSPMLQKRLSQVSQSWSFWHVEPIILCCVCWGRGRGLSCALWNV